MQLAILGMHHTIFLAKAQDAMYVSKNITQHRGVGPWFVRLAALEKSKPPTFGTSSNSDTDGCHAGGLRQLYAKPGGDSGPASRF